MRRSSIIWWVFIVLAICVYSLPWVITPGASLTLNGYDLAEWSSLYPGVRTGSTPLLITFALRSPLLWLSILIAFGPISPMWLRIPVILAIASVLLPPPEFFASDYSDPNFRQMLFLAGAVVIAGLLGMIYRGQKWREVIQTIAFLAIIIVSLSGLGTGFRLMRDFNLPVQIGPGGAALVLMSILFLAGLIIKRGNLHEVTS